MTASAPAQTRPASSEMLSPRRRRGLVLLLGGIVVALVVEPVGSAALYWMPLVLGLAYLGAALVGGRRGALWAPGLVVTCWAIAVLLVLIGTAHVDFTAAAVTGLGVGAVLASLLPRFGVSAQGSHVAVAVLLVGLIELGQAQLHGVLDKGWAYGVLLIAWGLWELRPGREAAAAAR